MDFSIPEDLQLLRTTVRDYVRDRLQPLAMTIEREERVPDEVLAEMKELGFFGLPFPEEYGGLGAGELGYCLAMEELGHANAAISNIIGGHSSLSGMAIYQRRLGRPQVTVSARHVRGKQVGSLWPHRAQCRLGRGAHPGGRDRTRTVDTAFPAPRCGSPMGQ